MKRSAAVSLVVMGAVTLAGCQDETIDTAVYSSVNECINGNIYTPLQCEADFKAATIAHQSTAPTFTTQAACEEQFGPDQCGQGTQQQAGGGFSFLPLFAGYMMGRALSGGAATLPPQPLYRKAGSGAYVNGGGQEVARSTGPTKVSARSPLVKNSPATTNTTSRGGFGARSSGVSA